MLTYYCWRCYGQNPHARGRCAHCGEESAPPEGVSFDERLLWALDHPLPERRLTAARTLGRRRLEAARPRLRELVSDPDPYLAAAALEALVTIDGSEEHRALLDEARGGGSAPVRAAARRLLDEAERQPGRSVDCGGDPT